jgi:RecJ-like exonuclease
MSKVDEERERIERLLNRKKEPVGADREAERLERVRSSVFRVPAHVRRALARGRGR